MQRRICNSQNMALATQTDDQRILRNAQVARQVAFRRSHESFDETGLRREGISQAEFYTGSRDSLSSFYFVWLRTCPRTCHSSVCLCAIIYVSRPFTPVSFNILFSNSILYMNTFYVSDF